MTVLKQLTALCAECGISDDIIDEQSFACFPESPTYVTYRARLEGTSETNSSSLISLIEEWVSGGAGIIVTGVLMTVDSKCSVTISSLIEEECTTTQPPTTDSTGTAAIIGGVLTVILILSVALTIAIIAVTLILKNRRAIKE